MLSISALIDFLMNLLRDPDARAEFEQNPDAALAAAGLAGVSAQDVRDASTIIGDSDGVRCGSDDDDDDDDHGSRSHRHDDHGSRSYGHDDHGSRSHGHDDHAVNEIHHVTKNYHVDEGVTVKNSFNTYNDYDYDYDISYVDNSTTAVNIDDRDTLIVAEDVDINDSFNGDSSANVLQNSGNSEEITVVQDSFNDVDQDVTAINDSIIVEDSFNEEDVEINVVAVNDSPDTTVVQDSANDTSLEAPAEIVPV